MQGGRCAWVWRHLKNQVFFLKKWICIITLHSDLPQTLHACINPQHAYYAPPFSSTQDDYSMSTPVTKQLRRGHFIHRIICRKVLFWLLATSISDGVFLRFPFCVQTLAFQPEVPGAHCPQTPKPWFHKRLKWNLTELVKQEMYMITSLISKKVQYVRVQVQRVHGMHTPTNDQYQVRRVVLKRLRGRHHLPKALPLH